MKSPNFIVSCILLLICINHQILSQNETQNWCFGTGVNLNFATNPPSMLATTSMSIDEGCTSISDGSGNLLFYSDGETVYNKAHAIMANGSGLIGFRSTSQSSIIVKKPGSNKEYYLFTLDDGKSVGRTARFAYSIINMSLAAGLGSVTAKNVVLSDSCTEMLAAVKNCNGIDTWVVVMVPDLDQYRAFRVGASGINLLPVKSFVGTWLFSLGTQGCMKISPNGKKIGFASWAGCPGSILGLYDFDPSSGVVSNPLIFGYNYCSSYGCEFSPDGTKFYSSSGNGILQWDLCAGSDLAIAASQTTVGSSPPNQNNAQLFLSMQLASNNKIYVIETAFANSLGVINSPNSIGTACGFTSHAQSIAPKYNGWGLPNFVSSYFKPLPSPITYTQSLAGCRTVSFTSPPINTTSSTCVYEADAYTGYKWIFGDPITLGANTSTLANPTHTFSSSGSFNVKMVLYTSCGTDTISKKVVIGCTNIDRNDPAPEFKLFPNPVIDKLIIENMIAGEFEIFNSLGNTILKVFLNQGSQTLNVENLNNGIYFVKSTNTNAILKFLKVP